MPLFQQSVLKKYINDLDKVALQTAWQMFQQHFFNTAIQQNIRDAKEEEYQEGFIRDLFVNVLNYILNPQPDYNFVLEKKSVTDATKSDGAILLNNEVIAVVELKDTGTSDLDKVSNQAFGYKHKHKNCNYVITSNFEKLRFYINDATDYEEFDLFTLTQGKFALLYLCLQKQNLLDNIPLQIKQASLVQEENVTKKLYADYSLFKRKLFQNIAEQNTQYDKLLLFKKTQKLLDRFLFILFAEDKLLLPPNSVRQILAQWEQLKELDNYVTLYSRFKKYFGYLNVGHRGKQHEIYAYNGGLFLPDDILDAIIIDDTILYEGTKTLSGYDFETDVDVNILGHIFEHSLTEIEELQQELEGKAIEKNKNKRKKEGVFYTPRYITKYIVENTVGTLCTQKKEELQINEETFAPKKRKDRKKILLDKIETYRNWLLQLTICDPACGSGAFLNAALEYLKAEHRMADELTARMLNVPIVFSDLDNSILENNLFGVDINEDAIEIAKLSLWLHTAKKGRKLSNLSNNIKCGNSLIDDVSIACDRAFKWNEEFKNVFDNGGFDVVIGNPPYGVEFTIEEKKYLKNRFTISTQGKIDSYRIFFEKGFELLKTNHILSYITPNTFLYNIQSKPLRKLMLTQLTIKDAVELRKNIFEDAPDIVTVILTILKIPSKKHKFRARVAFHNRKYSDINNDKWDIDQIITSNYLLEDVDLKINLRSNGNFSSIKEKIEIHPQLTNFFHLKQGTKPYGVKEDKEIELIAPKRYDDSWEKAINGRNIGQYFINSEDLYVQRNPLLHSALPLEIVQMEKIYFQRMRKISLFPRIVSCYDNDHLHGLYTCSVIYKKPNNLNLKYLLCILNSYLINLWYKYFDTDIEIKLASVKRIPIPEVSAGIQQPFIAKADIMLSKNKELNQLLQQFIQLLQSKFATININNKLQNWANLTSNEFFKELTKQKIKLSLSEQQEWLQYFEEQKIKANAIQQVIQQTDKEIDKMVYELYELSEEEVRILEER